MREINVGLVGTGVMGKAHSLGYVMMPIMFWPPPARPRLKVIADVTEELAQAGAERFGFERWVVGWEKLIKDEEVELLDICAPPHIHKDIAIAGAQAGKHILCEKPLAMNAQEAQEMLQAVEEAGVKHMVGFNYRRTPAVAFAKQLIEEGALGKILSFRGFYLLNWRSDPRTPLRWRFKKALAGSGTLGDASTHVMDYARYLVGEITEVVAVMETWVKQRPIPEGVLAGESGEVDVDDEVCYLFRFENGALGKIEATGFAHGRDNYLGFEINGTKGSVFFDFERMNELRFCSAESPEERRGYQTIRMGPPHPYGHALWPIAGLNIGYAETKAIECHDFIDAIVNDKQPAPNFYDGLKACQFVDAVIRSAEEHRWIAL